MGINGVEPTILKKRETVLITGITGMDASVMARYLLGLGYKVVGIKRRSSTENLWRIEDISRHDNFTLVEGDITDLYSMIEIVREHSPKYVLNFAAMSHVGTSFSQPQLTFDVTANGAINVMNACRLVDKSIKIFQASTSEMFGCNYTETNGQKIQDHNTPFHARSPYAVAKQAAHDYAIVMRESYDMFICPTILFNHTHTSRGENFVERKITRYVGRLKHALDSGKLRFHCLSLGNIESYRDFGWSPDYMEAVWTIMTQDKPDDYIIATEKTYQIKDILELAFGKIGLNWSDYVNIDKSLFRPNEVEYLRGSYQKLKNNLGWEPKHDIEYMIDKMVEHDIELARKE